MIADYSQEGSSQTKHGHGHNHERIGDHNHNHEYMVEGVIGAGKEVVKGETGEFEETGLKQRTRKDRRGGGRNQRGGQNSETFRAFGILRIDGYELNLENKGRSRRN